MLCHRLGLIPIKADADDFEDLPPAGESGRSRTDFTDKNAIKFNLKVECPSLATLQKMAGNKKEPLGKQADLPAGKQGLVHDDIILIKLAPGQVRASPLSDA